MKAEGDAVSGGRGSRPAAPASGVSTRAVHAGAGPRVPNAPVVGEIVQSATFFTEPEPSGEVRYTRYGTNPVHLRLGAKLASLEGAEAAIVLASGNAAMALALLSCVGAGDHVVAASQLYGGTTRLLRRELPRLGIDVVFIEGDDWAGALTARTRALLIEMPTNPTLRVPDPRPIAALAQRHGIALLVDATFATPVNFRPLEHGADLVIHSATKYLGGHSDLTAGVVAGRADLVAEVREKLISFGPVLDPHAGWLLERGIKTLGVRVERQNASAQAIAERLAAHPAVLRAVYPGLPSHPDHALARELFSGYGGVVSMVVRGGDRSALDVLARLKVMSTAPSLGGVETLVSMPRFTSHVALEREERLRLGIDDGFVRIAVGVEDVDDLIADLDQALEAVAT